MKHKIKYLNICFLPFFIFFIDYCNAQKGNSLSFSRIVNQSHSDSTGKIEIKNYKAFKESKSNDFISKIIIDGATERIYRVATKNIVTDLLKNGNQTGLKTSHELSILIANDGQEISFNIGEIVTAIYDNYVYTIQTFCEEGGCNESMLKIYSILDNSLSLKIEKKYSYAPLVFYKLKNREEFLLGELNNGNIELKMYDKAMRDSKLLKSIPNALSEYFFFSEQNNIVGVLYSAGDQNSILNYLLLINSANKQILENKEIAKDLSSVNINISSKYIIAYLFDNKKTETKLLVTDLALNKILEANINLPFLDRGEVYVDDERSQIFTFYNEANSGSKVNNYGLVCIDLVKKKILWKKEISNFYSLTISKEVQPLSILGEKDKIVLLITKYNGTNDVGPNLIQTKNVLTTVDLSGNILESYSIEGNHNFIKLFKSKNNESIILNEKSSFIINNKKNEN